MMFHREPRLFVEAEFEDLSFGDLNEETTTDAFIERMLKAQEETKIKAGENIKKAQKKQKEGYDKRHCEQVCMEIYN